MAIKNYTAIYYALLVLTIIIEVIAFLDHQTIFKVGPRAMFFSCLSDAGLFLIISVLLPPKWRWCNLLLLFLYTTLIVTNAIYTQYFNDYLPLSLIKAYNNIGADLSGFILPVLKWWMLLLILPFVGCTIYYVIYHRQIETRHYSLKIKFTSVLVSLILFTLGQGYLVSLKIKDSDYATIFSKNMIDEYMSAEGNVQKETAKWGMLAYYINSMMPWYHHVKFTEDTWGEIGEFVTRPKGELPPGYDAQFKKNREKKLILIVVESFTSQTFNKDITGIRLTPYIDSLSVAKGTVFVPNLAIQTRGGVSSDAQLMFNTGLYPLSRGAATFESRMPDLPSLATYVKQIGNGQGRAIEVIGEDPEVWNHHKTSMAWGYDTLYHSLANGNPEKSRYGVADHYIFKKVKEILETDKQVRMLTICTLSMHGTYTEVDLGRFRPEQAGESLDMCAFYEMTKRFDEEIRNFISFLKEKGMYDDSIIVIVGDHNPHIMCDSAKTTVPLMILNTGVTYITGDVVGQIDVYPTVLDAMGMLDNAGVWPGFGHSIFRARKGIVGYTKPGGWYVKDLPADSAEVAAIRKGHELSEVILSGIGYEFKDEYEQRFGNSEGHSKSSEKETHNEDR